VLFGLGALAAATACAADVSLKTLDGTVRVEIGGELFTEYVYQGYAKPILYPIIGPGGIGMTRNFPMKETKGEAKDHPHQKSLWYTHGSVNGVDFWAEGSKAGTICQDKLVGASVEGGKASIKTENTWKGPTGTIVCTDARTVTCFAIPGGRAIDFEITLRASAGDLLLGDTKEGTMGIRTNPALRLRNDERQGVTTANGKAVNSEGLRDGAIWGKRAAWVDYWATIDGKVVGIAIFDCPANPRHPTWWHARDYGLIAANPFGISDFEKKPKGTGNLTIPAGSSMTWRYRFIFHEGDAEQAKVATLYKDYAAAFSAK
jgi:hypothetical protein